MSRLSFRAALETPRPWSALALIALANLTLAITGQIPVPVLVVQGAAFFAAIALRGAPRPWQQRGLWLNAGLAASALLALFAAPRGASAGVVLAQLAVLASGLQLLDARPRRSEFVLVALALFQVVLASSLTDSLLFPPLLIAFLPTCVWTLLVHTLRSEALEAGDPAAARDAITPGLLGMTLAATSVAMLLALCLFFLLPRMHEGLLHAGSGSPVATGGFSDHVDLGDLGRIHGDPTVMLRVETIAGTPPAARDAYWRGLAFDRFDGRTWSASSSRRRPVDGDPAIGVSLDRHGRPPDLVQRILREPMAAGVLFGAGEPVSLQGSTGRVERDASGSLYAPQSADARVRYEVSALAAAPDDEALSRDVAEAPRGGDPVPASLGLAPEITARANEIVATSPNDLARARALEIWLRRNGRYSDTPPREQPGDSRPPIERFLLGEMEGHCEYFASAMVVLARSVGLPARLVNGFAGGRRNPVGDFVELTGSDAHAWVEVHFRDHGWVRFDPTPPDLRLSAARAESTLRQRLGDLRSALELFWFRHVVEFDRDRQIGVAFQSLHAIQRWLEREPGAQPDEPERLDRPTGSMATPVLAVGAGLALAALVWRARRGRERAPALPRAYARALRIVARHGLVRPPGCTPRAFAREVASALPAAGGAAFRALTEGYLGERYGGRPAGAAQAELRALRDSLRE